jgi:hypothetical protein
MTRNEIDRIIDEADFYWIKDENGKETVSSLADPNVRKIIDLTLKPCIEKGCKFIFYRFSKETGEMTLLGKVDHIDSEEKCVDETDFYVSQLKDLKEKLGIDPVIALRALDSGIYYKDWRRGNDIRKTDISYIGTNFLGYRGYSLGAWDADYPDIDICFLYKEYGITWALTREELLQGRKE